jgi:hypothetical protein
LPLAQILSTKKKTHRGDAEHAESAFRIIFCNQLSLPNSVPFVASAVNPISEFWLRLRRAVCFVVKLRFSLLNCGGALKIIAAIEDPPVIDTILSHLGLPTRAPPRAPARRVDPFQTI